MKERGFTILELLVTMVIVSIVVGISYYAFDKMLTGSKSQMKSMEAQMDKLLGLENMRLDVEHAGYGIAVDETASPMSWNATGRILVLRSTMSNTNQGTQGWLTVDCTGGGNWTGNIVVDKRGSTTQDIVFLSTNATFVKSANSSNINCPALDVLIGYPYDSGLTNGCNVQQCVAVTYELSSTQTLASCNPNTRNLLRKVGASAGTPVLNCVSDWDMRFNLDTNGDGIVDSAGAANFANATQVVSSIIYILMQEGRYDKDYVFSGNTTDQGITIDGLTLTLPSGFRNYRWRVAKMVVRNMNLQKD